jgi:hypothetical protein
MIKKNTDENKWIQLLTWIIADGTIVDLSKYAKDPTKSFQKRIQFKLSKTRKIVSLISLLNDMGIPYKVTKVKKSGENKLDPYLIKIYGEPARNIFSKLDGIKKIPESWENLSYEQMIVFLKTLEQTDGYRSINRLYWSTIDVESSRRIKKLLKKHGVAWKEGSVKSGFNPDKIIPRISINIKGLFDKKEGDICPHPTF